jgi:hypothetical protein
MAGTIHNLTSIGSAKRRMTVAHLVVLSLGVLFLAFETLHPAADLLHANAHRSAASAGASAGGLLNNDLSESHAPYAPDVHPIARIPLLHGHLILVPPALRPEDVYQELPFHIPI